MTTPIIAPSIMTEEQRAAIKQLYYDKYCRYIQSRIFKIKYSIRCQLSIMEDIFGSEFFNDIKQE